MAAILLAGALPLSACGSGDPSPVVVRVAGHTIAKAALEHWAAVEAVLSYQLEPTQPPPIGLVPDPPGYAKCIGYIAALTPKPVGSPPHPTKAQLKQLCEQKERFLEHHMLDILISDYWIEAEGAARGLTVGDDEIERNIKEKYPTVAAYRAFLKYTGQTAGDERLLLRGDLMATKLEQSVTTSMKSLTAEQKLQAFTKFMEALAQRRSKQTTCKPGYVVQECKEYNGPKAAV